MLSCILPELKNSVTFKPLCICIYIYKIVTAIKINLPTPQGLHPQLAKAIWRHVQSIPTVFRMLKAYLEQ